MVIFLLLHFSQPFHRSEDTLCGGGMQLKQTYQTSRKRNMQHGPTFHLKAVEEKEKKRLTSTWRLQSIPLPPRVSQDIFTEIWIILQRALPVKAEEKVRAVPGQARRKRNMTNTQQLLCLFKAHALALGKPLASWAVFEIRIVDASIAIHSN